MLHKFDDCADDTVKMLSVCKSDAMTLVYVKEQYVIWKNVTDVIRNYPTHQQCIRSLEDLIRWLG